MTRWQLALILVADVVWLGEVEAIGGWGGFWLLVAGIVAIALAAVWKGADSRDGGDWKPLFWWHGARRQPPAERLPPAVQRRVDEQIGDLERHLGTGRRGRAV